MVDVLRPPPLLVAMLGTVLLAACGAPPEPLPKAPPTPGRSGGAAASGAVPSLPSVPAGAYPTTGIPVNPYPTNAYPTNPLPTQTYTTQPTIPTSTTTPAAPPAPACGGSPTKRQMLNAVQNNPGIPTDRPLEVRFGPYCAGGWQFAILGIVGQDEDEVDPLLLITKGRPTSLRVVAAGADICDGLDSGTPAGIKARACGTS
jgi:hypothetical protein